MQTLCENAFKSNARLTFCLLSSSAIAWLHLQSSHLCLHFRLSASMLPALALKREKRNPLTLSPAQLGALLHDLDRLGQQGKLQTWKLISSFCSAFLGHLSPLISLQDLPLS